MANEVLKREENHKTSGAGVSSEADKDILMFRVDPVTNLVIAEANADSLVATSLDSNKRDENFVPTVYGISDDDGTTLIPIRTDENGYLLAEF